MIFKNKKSQSYDTVIFIGICIIFVFFGATLPFIQRDFGESQIIQNNLSVINSSATSEDSLDESLRHLGQDPLEDPPKPNMFMQVMTSIMLMFVWTFGRLPLWVDIIIEIFRLILYFIVIRIIRGI